MKTSNQETEHTYDALFAEYERAKYPILMAPFHGATVPVMVRELTEAQILSCGDFSLISTFADKVRAKSSKFNMRELLAYSERNHEVAKAALVRPTYDDIISIYGKDSSIVDVRERLATMRKKLAETPDGKERKELEYRIDAMRVWADLILPEDFLGFIVGYALGIQKSDIKLVSEDMLLNAAVLAEKGHDNPSDHIRGSFTDFMRDDINARAWLTLKTHKDKGNSHGS